MLESFCDKLAKEWSIESGFATNVPNVFAIPLEEDLEIVLTAIKGGFTLMSTLSPVIQDNKEELYIQLLSATMLGQGTKGAALALDEKENIVLSQTVTHISQYREFYEILEDFIDTVDTWRAVVSAEK